MKRLVAAAALAAMLAGCGGGPTISRERIDRALAKAPGIAQPSKVVAQELAFARMAQEEGQWTAFRAFAAPGAIIHGRNGPVVAITWLAGLKDPEEAVRWSPDTIWMSCDSTVAVSQGRFRDPEDQVGTFVTVWKRQPNREYLWIYDVAVLDDPQPPPRPPEGPIDPDAIVVSALDSIKGLVADCPRRGMARADRPQPPALNLPEGMQHAVTTSNDGTLRWRWEHPADGERRFVAEYLTSGQWQTALDQPLGVVSPEDAE